jgi:RNA polymerase sigma-70 factor, ECF subfamily
MEKRMNKGTNPGSSAADSGEVELLRRIARQDRDALAELYGMYHARLFKFIYRLIRSYSAADELVNDIMLAVWQSADTFRGDSKVSTWIFGIAYRQAMRRISRRKLRLVPLFGGQEEQVDDAGTAETEDWVQRGLDTLPAAQRLTVILVFYLGLSYPEVAEVTDCPVNTVKSRMFHARLKLREELSASAETPRGTQR